MPGFDAARAWLVARHLPIAERLAPVLEGLWTDGYFIGAVSSRTLLAHHGLIVKADDDPAVVTMGADWAHWTPGDWEAARELLGAEGMGDGLAALLEHGGIVLKGIEATKLDQLARILANGLNNGDSPAKIATAIRKLVDDAKWAYRVALTETTRAVSSATLARYWRNGVEAKEWMSAGDQRVCPECKVNEDQGAIALELQFADGNDAPPGHVLCRCSIAPAWLSADEAAAQGVQLPPVLPAFGTAAAERALARAVDEIFTEAAELEPEAVLATAPPGGPAGAPAPVMAPFPVRPALAQATSIPELQKAFQREARRITGRRNVVFDLGPRVSALNAREVAEGVLRTLEEFPGTEIELRVGAVRPGRVAETDTNNGHITYNPQFMYDRPHWAARKENAEQVGFHRREMFSPPGTAVHEVTHAMQFQYDPMAARRLVSKLISRLAEAADMDIVPYVQRELGDYALKHLDEMIAQGMADALVSPNPSELSIGVRDILRDLYAAGRKVVQRGTLPQAADLSGMTVKDLRALAVQRGLTVPARTLKKDLVAMLEQQPAAAVPNVLEEAARVRQAVIDVRKASADALAEVASLLDSKASARALASRAQAIANRVTDQAAKDVASLVRAMKTGDEVKIRRAMTALEKKTGLRQVGGAPGEVVRFDRTVHAPIGGDASGMVRVLRPGYELNLDGELVRLSKATVERVTADELRQIEQAAKRAAARERNRIIEQATGTGRLLAELDELIAKNASLDVFVDRLDEALIAPGQVFANADRAVLDAIKKSKWWQNGDVSSLRRTIARLTTKSNLAGVERAGVRAVFNPTTMEGIGGVDVEAGAKVLVIRRGTAFTLPDGSTMQLTKAQVVVVRSSAETVQAGDFTGLKRVGPQGGSNPGGVFQAEDGSKFYIKASSSEQWAKEQALASALYREAGLVSPEITIGSGVGELGTGAQTATRIIEGVTEDGITGAKFLAKAREGFATDAWLADWDIGQHGNMVALKGQPVRMDIGGSLRFRARGGPKGSAFGNSVSEWLTMRDPRNVSGHLFKDIKLKDLEASVKNVEAITPERIRALVKEYGLDKPLADTLIARRADLIKRLQEELEAAKPKVFEKGGNHLAGSDRGANLVKEVINRRVAYQDKAPDPMLSAIAELQGFDAKPRVVTRAEMTRLIKEGHTLMYRGVQKSGAARVRARAAAGQPSVERAAHEIHEAMRAGDAHFGLGIYGNGYYFTTVRTTAVGYSDRTAGSVARATLRKDARTIDSDEAYRLWQAWQRSTPTASEVFSDVGRWAAAQGYDALVKNFNVTHGRTEKYFIVLNRAALIVEKAAPKAVP